MGEESWQAIKEFYPPFLSKSAIQQINKSLGFRL